MERSACHKCFEKGQNVNIFEHSPCDSETESGQFWLTLTYQRQFLDVIQCGFAVKMPPVLI